MSRRYVSAEQIDAVLPLKTWWAVLVVLPLSRRLIRFAVNQTCWTPNAVTLTGIFLRSLTALLFLWGTRCGFAMGALVYVIAYVCDCTDGAVARLTGKTSDFGRYLDHISDLLGDILILLALAWSQQWLAQPFIWAMVQLHLAECYISYLAGFALKQHEGQLGGFVLLRVFNRYRSWWFRRNIKSFLSFPDYTAFVFVLCPLLGQPKAGLQWGFWLLLLVVSYTVLSTFAALHTKGRQFP
ncbi:CDP-alcohol phosphatidyltransferase family protein [Desulfuromonas thiophila]|uniref:CDP-alcohol phosphatidyltransferase n=1 Tax=Desulfuromonas thiophila TaxID=57664 RepID=A0A1G7ETH4_9BACT|nr:CDP-alcohol phosphatidyltransferase family protein [Desulfuromonas thiophila]SDE66897.1 CDP-alcohol phosphatidyltransferase [Desulfuromonas thiophila]